MFVSLIFHTATFDGVRRRQQYPALPLPPIRSISNRWSYHLHMELVCLPILIMFLQVSSQILMYIAISKYETTYCLLGLIMYRYVSEKIFNLLSH